MKRILITLFAIGMTAMSSMSMAAMSNSQIRRETRFLTDKMAYELNLNTAQYNDVYEINYDYIYNIRYLMDDVVRGYEWALNDYYTFLDVRNDDLRWVLSDMQYRRMLGLDYFIRPIYMNGPRWNFRVYINYPNVNMFFFGKPYHYRSYSGIHYRTHYNNVSFYCGRYNHNHYGHVYSVRDNRVFYNNRRSDFGSVAFRSNTSARPANVAKNRPAPPAFNANSRGNSDTNRRGTDTNRSAGNNNNNNRATDNGTRNSSGRTYDFGGRSAGSGTNSSTESRSGNSRSESTRNESNRSSDARRESATPSTSRTTTVTPSRSSESRSSSDNRSTSTRESRPSSSSESRSSRNSESRTSSSSSSSKPSNSSSTSRSTTNNSSSSKPSSSSSSSRATNNSSGSSRSESRSSGSSVSRSSGSSDKSSSSSSSRSSNSSSRSSERSSSSRR